MSALFALVASLGAAPGCKDDPEEPAEAGSPAEAAEVDTDYVEKGDLPKVRERGVLRILVFGGESESFLPRTGSPDADERELALGFADKLGLTPGFVPVESFAELFTALEEGRGDVAAARITVTDERKERLAFTRPLSVVAEVLVGREGGPAPKTKEELAGRKVLVRPGSSYHATLRALSAELEKAGQPGVEIVAAPDDLDDEQVVYRVAEGEADLTVIDDGLLTSIQAYENRVVSLFPLKEGQQIAWAVRKDAPKLKAAADAFLIAQAMTGHTREVFKGDLDGIKERKVIRVLTRNNGVTYYLHRGMQVGFDYELASKVAKDLGLRLEVVVPPKATDLIPWLKKGRGDFIAGSFTATEERAADADFTRPYLYVDEVLVARSASEGEPPTEHPATLADLKGRTIHVRKGSSYVKTLEKLQKDYGPFEVVQERADVETEKLLAKVAAGEIPLTVADSHILAVEQTLRPELEAVVKLTQAAPDAEDAKGRPRDEAIPIAFAVRKESPQLKAWLDGWVKKNYRGLEYNILKNKYFKNEKAMAARGEERVSEEGRISPYDDLIKKYAAQYELDWRLMAAQAYAESGFDPNAKSWVGALGLFQVMPRTGAEMGFRNLRDPEIGTHAGIKYMHRLIKLFEPTLPLKERVRFALASYNAGRGHVIDARRLAAAKGWDKDKWFGHVERAMLLLEQREYARKARHGYCRGSEPVAYVSKIQTKYDAYSRLFPAEADLATKGPPADEKPAKQATR